MNKIKEAVPSQSSYDQPKIELEPEEGNAHEHHHHERLNDQGMNRTTHHGKQYIIRSDHDEQRRIECPVTVKAGQLRQERNEKSQNDSNDVFDDERVTWFWAIGSPLINQSGAVRLIQV